MTESSWMAERKSQHLPLRFALSDLKRNLPSVAPPPPPNNSSSGGQAINRIVIACAKSCLLLFYYTYNVMLGFFLQYVLRWKYIFPCWLSFPPSAGQRGRATLFFLCYNSNMFSLSLWWLLSVLCSSNIRVQEAKLLPHTSHV